MPFHRVQSYVKNRQSMYACTCFIGYHRRFRHTVGLKSDENTLGRQKSAPFRCGRAPWPHAAWCAPFCERPQSPPTPLLVEMGSIAKQTTVWGRHALPSDKRRRRSWEARRRLNEKKGHVKGLRHLHQRRPRSPGRAPPRRVCSGSASWQGLCRDGGAACR